MSKKAQVVQIEVCDICRAEQKPCGERHWTENFSGADL